MERLLVTGIDHPIGGNLALALADRAEVLGLYDDRAVVSPSFCTAACDTRETSALRAILAEWRPQWILHCGPLAKSSWDANESAADAEAPELAGTLANLAVECSARLTVVSSDVVFAGPRMFHEEGWPAANEHPGAAKVRTLETGLAATRALVVRTHAFGWSPVASHACLAERLFNHLARGGAIAPDGRRHATPILATDLAELLWRAYELGLHGLYHVAGAERTSPWGFACELAAAMGLDLPSERLQISGARGDSLGETSLNCKRARRELEMATPMLREGLDRFVAQARNGWRDHWRAPGQPSPGHVMAA